MHAKRVAISQSNYIPWKGYFNLIASADVFVILDDVQYTRRDWRNRNLIKTPNGLTWLTIPVASKGRFHHRIDQILVSDHSWNTRHWDAIYRYYKTAPCFSFYGDELAELFLDEHPESLSGINVKFLERICRILKIDTPLLSSAAFEKRSDRNLRLLDICTALSATEYLTGPAARSYIDESIFESHGIDVLYTSNHGFEEYEQLHPPFDHQVSIIDTLLNTGPESPFYVTNHGPSSRP